MVGSKRALAALCCLTTLFSSGDAYFFTSSRTMPGGVQQRLEIHQLMRDPVQWNLFLLSLQRMQQTPENFVDSYYQIGGIHGLPHQSWDDQPPVQRQVANAGYCPHGTQLFYLWHRPYLAVFEQSLINNARAIAQQSRDQRYQNAANTLRLPYWDWASNSTVPQEIYLPTVTVLDVQGRPQQIANPLFSYRFQGQNPFGLQSTWRDRNYLNNLAPLAGNSRGWVALMLNTFNVCWKSFVSQAPEEGACQNTPFTYSLESIHSSVHTMTGGTMGPVDSSGFDPIFWLHHANVDRLGAMWQAINPNTFVEPTYSSITTFNLAPSWRDANTPLFPFRYENAGNSWWTSAYSRSPTTFGYTYPELQVGTTDPQQVANAVWRRAQQLYGTGRTMLALSTGNTVTSKRDEPARAGNSLTTPPALEQLQPFAKELIGKDGEFSEYTARVAIDKGAMPSSFTVNLFLGDGNGVTNNAGAFSVLRMDTPANKTAVAMAVKGAVTLTDPLLNKLVKGDLKAFDKETVAEYIKQNLKWKIVSFDGKDLSAKAADAKLDVTLVHATVTPADVKGKENAVQVSAPETVYDVTKA